MPDLVRRLALDPPVKICTPESPLPPDPDRRELAVPDQPVNRPRRGVQIAKDFYGRQKGLPLGIWRTHHGCTRCPVVFFHCRHKERLNELYMTTTDTTVAPPWTAVKRDLR
jgi:hypothetical protein